MSGDEPVTRYEFETYKSLARELRDADRAATQRVSHEVELVEQAVTAKLGALETEVETRFSNADARAERRREWSWQTKVTVSGLAIALAGLWVQAVASAHK